MVCEVIRYELPPEVVTEFLDAYRAAARHLQADPHCLDVRVLSSLDEPGRVQVLIEWDSIEGHERGFTDGPHFRDFIAQLRQYLGHIVEMSHYRDELDLTEPGAAAQVDPEQGSPVENAELRVVLTVDDFDEALAAYRDALGMREIVRFPSPGRVVLLDAGRATIEIADDAHAADIDAHEVGRRHAAPVRLAVRVADIDGAQQAVAGNGFATAAEPRQMPWGSTNARLTSPEGVPLTLFAEERPDTAS